MNRLFEITMLSPLTRKVEQLRIEAATLMDVERIKSALVLQGFVTMSSREVSA